MTNQNNLTIEENIIFSLVKAPGAATLITRSLGDCLSHKLSTISTKTGNFFMHFNTPAMDPHNLKGLANVINSQKSILFFDDFYRGHTSVMNRVFEIIDKREIDGVKLNDNVYIVLSGRISEDEYGIFEPMVDTAILNKLKIIPSKIF